MIRIISQILNFIAVFILFLLYFTLHEPYTYLTTYNYVFIYMRASYAKLR